MPIREETIMSNQMFQASPFEPIDFYSNHVLVSPEGGVHGAFDEKGFVVMPFQYTDWQTEELSWRDSVYLHAGLNPFIWHKIKGSDCTKLLEDISVSTYRKFPIGKARHVILCNDDGTILMDGIALRVADDEILGMCLPVLPAILEHIGGNYDVEVTDITNERFFFQLCGPRSLEVVEAACREDLHDIKFMWARDSKIDGRPVTILRTGMAGTLGYEVHGLIEDAIPVYEALMAAGEPFGIQKLGRHAYRNTHTEGSVPQGGTHFVFNLGAPYKLEGSLPRDSRLVFRTPIDLGWEKMISFKHDFPGKDALAAELEAHHNTMVHLVWDPEDILKVAATWFEPGNSADVMDMVEDYDYMISNFSLHIDAVYDGDKLVGAASGRMLCPKTREMMSLATIDTDYAVEGREVEVLWGNPGTRQMRIRAKVTLAPYIKECRNDSFDVEQIPHPVF